MAKDVSFVNIFGTYLATRADALKDWTGANCQVKSVSVTDGFATALSPTVEIRAPPTALAAVSRSEELLSGACQFMLRTAMRGSSPLA
jgi:hypothetical protein